MLLNSLFLFVLKCITTESNPKTKPDLYVDGKNVKQILKRTMAEWKKSIMEISNNTVETFPISNFDDSKIENLNKLSELLLSRCESSLFIGELFENEIPTNKSFEEKAFDDLCNRMPLLPIYIKMAHSFLETGFIPKIENITDIIDKKIPADRICFCQRQNSTNKDVSYLLRTVEMAINLKMIRDKIEELIRTEDSLLCKLVKNFVLFCLEKNPKQLKFNPVDAFLKTCHVFLLEKLQSKIKTISEGQNSYEIEAPGVECVFNDIPPFASLGQPNIEPLITFAKSFEKVHRVNSADYDRFLIGTVLLGLVKLRDFEYTDLVEKYLIFGKVYMIASFCLQTEIGLYDTIFYRDKKSSKWVDFCGKSITNSKEYNRELNNSTGFAIICLTRTNLSIKDPTEKTPRIFKCFLNETRILKCIPF